MRPSKWLFVFLVCSALVVLGASSRAQYDAGTLTPPPAGWVNPVKTALKAGKVVIGATITSPDPDVARSVANAGYDFLWIEMEHSPLSLESVRNIMLAMHNQKAMPFVRVPWHEQWLHKRVLDIGALGVITPVVSTRAEAEQAVAAAYYPPRGVRGVGNSNAISLWGLANYTQWANENIVNIVIIENPEGVKNVEAIASVPGIDVLMIGASDLASYSGLARTDPKYQAMVSAVLAAGKKHNLAVGWPAGNGGAAALNPLIDQGFRFFQLADERGLMMAGARASLDGVKGR